MQAADVLEPRIEEVLHRFRIPSEEAQGILDEIMLTMLIKRDRIRDPERWMMRTLKNRCVMHWRERRRRLYRVIDSGLLTLLSSPEVSVDEKGALREELQTLVEGIEPECRAYLERRYGLEPEHASLEIEPWAPQEDEGTTLRCIGALARRFSSAGSRRRMENLNLFSSAPMDPF